MQLSGSIVIVMKNYNTGHIRKLVSCCPMDGSREINALETHHQHKQLSQGSTRIFFHSQGHSWRDCVSIARALAGEVVFPFPPFC